jgi:hypothetical protein
MKLKSKTEHNDLSLTCGKRPPGQKRTVPLTREQGMPFINSNIQIPIEYTNDGNKTANLKSKTL